MAAPSRARSSAIALVLGLVLAVAGPLLPVLAPASAHPARVPTAAQGLAGLFAAPVARAAEGIDLRTKATYTVDPAGQAVRVVIDITARNTTRDLQTTSGTTRYYYDGVALGIQEEATRIRASAGGSTLRTKVAKRDGYLAASVVFARNLFYGQTTTIRLQYDLPSGAPRSDSDIRVGSAFATFSVWAFGDSGTVTVRVPTEFEVKVDGEDLGFVKSGDASWTILVATVTNTDDWFAWITGTNEGALTAELLKLPDGDEIRIHAWPEDTQWRSRVMTILADGVPALAELIGLPWPVDGALDVYEVHTPLLEGYAGFFYLDESKITISEDLDALVIVHEASHAWFNGELFDERWISEGLADEYASRVLDAIGEDATGPEAVAPSDAVAFALNTWSPPAAIRDDDSAAREDFGYDASWTVMRRIVDDVGEDGMRAVFAAADARTIAYAGEGNPETDNRAVDWRRFLDHLEEAGGATEAEALYRDWIVDVLGERELDERADAREVYAALVEAGDGWLPPVYVRLAMAKWTFAQATRAIEEATGVLDAQEALDARAATNGIALPTGMEAAYEGAADGFDQALELAKEQDNALTAVVEATAVVAAERDLFTTLGLEGTSAEDAVAAARAAFTAGELDDAVAGSQQASALIAAAPAAGQTKVAIGAGVVIGVLVLLLVVVLLRRRRRRARLAGAPLDAPVQAVVTEPYGTLDEASTPRDPGDPPTPAPGGQPS